MSDQDQRLLRLERQMQRQADEFDALKLLVEKNNTNLEEFIDLAKALKFGMKILGFLERTAVFIAKIAAAGGILWASWKYLVREALK